MTRAQALTQAATLIEVVANRQLEETKHAADTIKTGDRVAFLAYQEALSMKRMADSLRMFR